MTRTHTAKIEIRRWKAHSCSACNARYAYLMVRKLAYGGSTPERAEEKVYAAAERALAYDVDRQPCPTCGLFQPDMIAVRRQSWHRWMLVAAILATGLIAGLSSGDAIQGNWALLAAMAQVAMIGVVGFLVDAGNPNRNLQANRLKAEQEIAAQRVRVLRHGTPLVSGFATSRMQLHSLAAFALAVVAVLAVPAAELVRQQSGWPWNRDWYPPVAGPGDETYIYLPDRDSISSMKGFWTGTDATGKDTTTVMARMVPVSLPPGEGQGVRASLADQGQFKLDASTRRFAWGDASQLKPSDKSTASRLWIRVKIPSDGDYAGKNLVCEIDLSVRYPVADKQRPLDETKQVRGQAELRVATTPLAGHTYRALWWGGFVGGEVLLIVSILVRLAGAAALRRTANPTEILC